MFQSFQNSPIYFTDEMQDSMEIENEWNKYDVKWEFDLAIIPIKEAHRYKQIKNDFTKITNTWYIEFYNNKKFE